MVQFLRTNPVRRRRGAGRGLVFWSFTLGVVLGMGEPGSAGAQEFPIASAGAEARWPISLTNYLKAALAQNERIQASLVSYQASNSIARSEWGIFEPNVVGSAERVENRRQNTSQQSVSLGTQLFDERNNLYSGALESLVPTGARLRLGYSLQDLDNNIQYGKFTNGEYVTFVGANLVQPLLRNAGPSVTLAGIRVADLSTEIAWQDYRRALSQVMGGAESAYLGLQLAQEQLRALDESVRVAETVLEDFRARAAAGKGSDLDVLQAEADLSSRRVARDDAGQRLVEAQARAASFIATTRFDRRGVLMALARPETPLPPLDLYERLRWMLTYNPEYIAQTKRIEQEGVRLAYARNQRLPQLDLKASYGLNGLGVTPSESWDQAATGDYASWYVGVEVRVPLLGDIRARNELSAAKARQQNALLGLKDLETQLANALSTTLHRIRHDHEAIAETETTVRLNQSLLETELARMEVGRASARHVMEIERDLLIAKINALGTVIRYQQSLIELEVLDGTYLARRNLESTAGQVAERIRTLMAEARSNFTQRDEWQNTPILSDAALLPPEP